MRPYIEASLVLVFSIVTTLLIMAAIFPRHALGSGVPLAESPRISPAVFIHGTHERPGTAPHSTMPRRTDRVESTRCPYLEALRAASRCPVASRRGAESPCPYLQGIAAAEPEIEDSLAKPHGQHI